MRGHNDYGRIFLEEPLTNEGNFRALVCYRVKGEDAALEEHLKNAPSNTMYTSTVVQIELIQLIGNIFKRNN